jgi:hypothetical protein
MKDVIAPEKSAISVPVNNCTLTDQKNVHLKFCITLYWSVLIAETQNRSISSFLRPRPPRPELESEPCTVRVPCPPVPSDRHCTTSVNTNLV